jgi:hypothetical protein
VSENWAAGLPTNALLISGPSKTADIQQTLAYGAHGPKELIVLVINAEGDRNERPHQAHRQHAGQPIAFVSAQALRAHARRGERPPPAHQLPRRDGLPDGQARRPVSRRGRAGLPAQPLEASASTACPSCPTCSNSSKPT